MATVAPPELDHPRLLPAVLVPESDPGRSGRTTRDWIVDVAFFLVAVMGGLVVLFTEIEATSPSDEMVFADLIAGALACLALWWRRRWPVGVAVALIPLGAFSAASSVAGLLAFFTVAVHRRLGITALLGLAGIAAGPVYFEIHPDPEVPYLLSIGFTVVVTLAVGSWGMFVRARRQLVLSLRERAERAEAQQQEHVERAREQERARIAREMHDVLAHRISLLSMHAGSLEFRPDAPPEEIARAAGVIRASAHQALEDLREVIGVLREPPGDVGPERPQPTLADLAALVEESRQAGVQVSSVLALDDLSAAPAAVGRTAMLSPTVTRRLIAHVADDDVAGRRGHVRELLGRLTEREREVALAIAEGKSNAQIGADLYMSVATVKAHVTRLLMKLELDNRVQIALLAHDAGVPLA